LGSLSAEQVAAVEALTRGLVNKFLHPPMQALKQAARENDSARLEALCETWSLPAGGNREAEPDTEATSAGDPETKKAEGTRVNENSEVGRP
jgi:glutamyl-tRNA reductase